MPEGPEVETIRAGLATNLVGQVFARVDVLFDRTFSADETLLNQAVIGARIAQVKRRGKVLIIELDSGWTMLCHLKMTGQIVLVQADGSRMAGGHPSESMAARLPDRSTRVVFGMESGDVLYFNDQRKFGWIRLVRDADVLSDPLIGRMGPEVLSPQFRLSYLRSQLKRRSRPPVKAIILDQAVVAGVGNIYADESLHLSRIHPAKLAGSLTDAEIKRLYLAVREIITAGIEHGGTSFSHYVNSLGGKGDYLDFTRVFRRDGQACPVCGTTILKTRVAGRGTHYCPTCQPFTETVAKT